MLLLTRNRRPALSMNFTGGQPANTTFTRSTIKNVLNSAGSLSSIAVDAYPLEFATDGSVRGALIEAASTNFVRNSVLAGAATGTPGTLPTNWSGSILAAGLTQQVVATGTSQGIPFIDIRVSGTVTSTTVAVLFFEVGGVIAATTGQVWNHNIYLSLVGGSFTNITTFDVALREVDSLNAFLRQTLVDMRSATSAWGRFFAAATLGASTATIVPALRVSYDVGAVIDYTLRIGGIQVEQTPFPTSFITTSGASATRALDNFTINSLPSFNLNSGTFYAESLTPPRDAANSQMLFQFDNNSADNALRAYFISTDGSVRFENRSAATGTVANSLVVPATNTLARVACSYQNGRIAVSANGSAVGTAAPAALPVGPLTNFRLGRSSTTNQFLNGHLRRFAYWPTTLPDATLRQLSATGAF